MALRDCDISGRLEELHAHLLEVEHLFKAYIQECEDGIDPSFYSKRLTSLTNDFQRLNLEICRLRRRTLQ